jgi:hypothetical protein
MWVPAPRGAIDPAAAGVDAEALEMPKAFAQLDAPPVFICGSARAGTTWTFDLFDRHPKVAAICESWILSQTHGVTSILTQPYWDLVAKQGWEKRVEVPFGAVQLLSYEEVLHDLRELLGEWLTKGLSPAHRYLAAKEPLDIGAAAILFPEARFIHVIRDGRNVALSMKRASESWDPTMGLGLPIEMRAEAWRRQVENIRSQRAGLGDRYMEIRYEEMRTDVRRALRTMFDFAQIPYDERLLGEIDAATRLSSYGESARRSGFRGGGENGDWRKHFSMREAWGFHRAAGDLLIDLGYEPEPGWWARGRIRRRAARARARRTAVQA